MPLTQGATADHAIGSDIVAAASTPTPQVIYVMVTPEPLQPTAEPTSTPAPTPTPTPSGPTAQELAALEAVISSGCDDLHRSEASKVDSKYQGLRAKLEQSIAQQGLTGSTVAAAMQNNLQAQQNSELADADNLATIECSEFRQAAYLDLAKRYPRSTFTPPPSTVPH